MIIRVSFRKGEGGGAGAFALQVYSIFGDMKLTPGSIQVLLGLCDTPPYMDILYILWGSLITTITIVMFCLIFVVTPNIVYTKKVLFWQHLLLIVHLLHSHWCHM